MRDPYKVLGVGRDADTADVKKAFRQLAKKFHPDQNKEPKAKENFAEVNAAYEILGDAEKRSQFDRGEIGPDGKPRFQGFEGFRPGAGPGAGGQSGAGAPGSRWSTGGRGGAAGTGGVNFEDLFGDVMGRGGFGSAGSAPNGARQRQSAQRGADISVTAAVTLEQLASGEKARVELPTGKTLEFAVPSGSPNGKVVRLKGQGQGSPLGGPAGDALVTIEFVPHPEFRPEGSNLRIDVPVMLEDAVLGGRVRVPTLEGSVSMTVPPGADHGRSFRMKGKGLPKSGGGRGDLLVMLRIALPDPVDPELETLMKRRKAERGAEVGEVHD